MAYITVGDEDALCDIACDLVHVYYSRLIETDLHKSFDGQTAISLSVHSP